MRENRHRFRGASRTAAQLEAYRSMDGRHRDRATNPTTSSYAISTDSSEVALPDPWTSGRVGAFSAEL
jgi:hypothetical protein